MNNSPRVNVFPAGVTNFGKAMYRSLEKSMVGGMVQNSTNQNHYQHQQPICISTFFFYINNKIRPTSTINIIINHRNMPNSTTRENQHQQKFLFSSTKICLTTNIGHQLQQQNTFNNLGTNDWLWSREVGTQDSNHGACWEIDATKCKVSGGTSFLQIWNS